MLGSFASSEVTAREPRSAQLSAGPTVLKSILSDRHDAWFPSPPNERYCRSLMHTSGRSRGPRSLPITDEAASLSDRAASREATLSLSLSLFILHPSYHSTRSYAILRLTMSFILHCSHDSRRKVKCGEERPTCRRCLSARVECAGYPPPSTTDKISNGNNNKNKRPNRQGGDTDSRRSSSTTGSSSSTSSTSSSANTSSTAESASDMARGRESPPLTGPVRKAARLTNNATNSESPSGYSTSPSGQEQSAPALYTSTGPRLSLDSTAGQSSMTYPRSSSRDSLNKRKSLSNVSTSSMSTSVSAPLYSARSFSNQSQSSLPSSRSNETIATAPTLSRVESTTSSSLPPVTTSSYTHTHTPSVGQYSSSSSSTFERDFNGYQRDIPIDNRYRFNETQQPSSSSSSLHHQQNHHHQHQPQQSAFSPTLAPPLQAQIQPSQIPFNGNTFAPFAFDSPFPIQPFASASPMIGASGTGQHSNASNNNNAIMQQANTPIDFDSLFGYSDKNIRQEENGPNSGEGAIGNGNRQEGGNVGAPFPVDYWEDADFVDRIMTGFRDVRANEGAQMMNAAGESLREFLWSPPPPLNACL